MHWLADYWWVILLLLVGVIWNSIKEMMRLDPKKYLDDKPDIPPHKDNNHLWDDEDDDWPKDKKH